MSLLMLYIKHIVALNYTAIRLRHTVQFLLLQLYYIYITIDGMTKRLSASATNSSD
jgi:hypothetical protein